jgi:hypothetical protein
VTPDPIPAEHAVLALRAFFPTTSVEQFDQAHIDRMREALVAGKSLEIVGDHTAAKHWAGMTLARKTAAALEAELAWLREELTHVATAAHEHLFMTPAMNQHSKARLTARKDFAEELLAKIDNYPHRDEQ